MRKRLAVIRKSLVLQDIIEVACDLTVKEIEARLINRRQPFTAFSCGKFIQT